MSLSAADGAADRLAEEYASVGVREEGGRAYLDCYDDSIPEDGRAPAPVRTYEVLDEDGTLALVGERCVGDRCRYHLDLPARDLGLCEACLERCLEAR